MNDNDILLARISTLEKKINGLYTPLKKVCSHSSEPPFELNQCRSILEKILYRLYVHETRKKLNRPMIGHMLSDKEFASKIPKKILPKIKYITDYGNLGSHDEGEVESKDVIAVKNMLIDVIEWFVMNYDLNQTDGRIRNEQIIEILSRLKEIYPDYLRPEIKSVKFIQNSERCFIEVSTENVTSTEENDDEDEIPVNLYNQTSERLDLAFERGGFNPERNITENVDRFFSNYNDRWLMVHIEPELFTEEAKNKIHKREGENIRKALRAAGFIKE